VRFRCLFGKRNIRDLYLGSRSFPVVAFVALHKISILAVLQMSEKSFGLKVSSASILSVAVCGLLPSETFGFLLGLKELPLTLSACTARIIDTPAGFSVVNYSFDLHVWCLLVP
jgi:hypothetical protein